MLHRPEAQAAAREYSGLRDFLDLLAEAGELARVRRPVDLDQELGAICVHNLRRQGPALLFEQPGGHSIPLLANLLSTRKRYSLALGCRPEEVPAHWNDLMMKPIPPVTVDQGPCQDVVKTGGEVDLTALPTPCWNQLDGGPYLTLSCHISLDPRTGQRNVGVYRNQVHDRNTLGVVAGPHTDLILQHRHDPETPFPVALVVGADPRVTMTASSPLPFGTDEIAMAGALRGAPIELVRCKTQPLDVPADAELVIEGELRPMAKHVEGPFGEYTGHYAGPRRLRPTIHVTAITHRRDPLLHLAYQGAPPHESQVMIALALEAELARTIALPGIRAIHLTPGGCGTLHAVVAVEKLYEGYGKTVALAMLRVPASRPIKHVTVVDEDVDPFDQLAVEWAVATRVQPHRDVEILTELAGTSIDPSLPADEEIRTARTAKMIVDATRYDARSYRADSKS